MAYFDHIAADKKKEAKEKYEELKKVLSKVNWDNDISSFRGRVILDRPKSKKKNLININDFHQAINHINDIELELENLKNKTKEYQDFFNTLQKLMPRQSSIHDILR